PGGFPGRWAWGGTPGGAPGSPPAVPASTWPGASRTSPARPPPPRTAATASRPGCCRPGSPPPRPPAATSPSLPPGRGPSLSRTSSARASTCSIRVPFWSNSPEPAGPALLLRVSALQDRDPAQVTGCPAGAVGCAADGVELAGGEGGAVRAGVEGTVGAGQADRDNRGEGMRDPGDAGTVPRWPRRRGEPWAAQEGQGRDVGRRRRVGEVAADRDTGQRGAERQGEHPGRGAGDHGGYGGMPGQAAVPGGEHARGGASTAAEPGVVPERGQAFPPGREPGLTGPRLRHPRIR